MVLKCNPSTTQAIPSGKPHRTNLTNRQRSFTLFLPDLTSKLCCFRCYCKLLLNSFTPFLLFKLQTKQFLQNDAGTSLKLTSAGFFCQKKQILMFLQQHCRTHTIYLSFCQLCTRCVPEWFQTLTVYPCSSLGLNRSYLSAVTSFSSIIKNENIILKKKSK